MRRRFAGPLADAADRAAAEWDAARSTARLWERDATLWTGKDEGSWLGWLAGPARESTRLGEYAELARGAARAGVADVVLLGMGGSSLGADVLCAAFGGRPGAPRLHVLDSTHPGQVARVFGAIEPRTTWVIVASKSGSTLEPNLLYAFFRERFDRELGGAAGSRFVAVTDPGSSLEKLARASGFVALVPGEPTIGGRFSALSPFGLVPAALLGVDLPLFLSRAAAMAERCRVEDAAANPGVALGLAMAAAAEAGRDKLGLVLAPPLAALGGWIEQLVAESTGKQGRMILPIAGESPAAMRDPEARLFVAVRFGGTLAPEQEAALDELAVAGQPVLELDCPSADDLGAEFFRWEIATAVAGARLAVHPFDQPDVEAAKVAARRVAKAIEETGALPAATPFAADRGVELHADAANAAALLASAGGESLGAVVRAQFARAQEGDYLALLAFLDADAANHVELEALRAIASRTSRVATTTGFGPRFLHSTGQAHKGGPGTGVFVQLTERVVDDLPVPGQRLTFGQALAAQAGGDLEVLAGRGRRHLRIHFARGAAAGWDVLREHLGSQG